MITKYRNIRGKRLETLLERGTILSQLASPENVQSRVSMLMDMTEIKPKSVKVDGNHESHILLPYDMSELY